MNAICVRQGRFPFPLWVHKLTAILISLISIGWSARAGGIVTNCTEANLRAALAGGGTVTFACDGTITLAAEMVITNNTFIDATGHSISLSGNNSVRIFVVTNGATLGLLNLTLRDGHAQLGGAIQNINSELRLQNCTLDGNTAIPDTSGAAEGGAIWNAGSNTSRLFVANCTFSRNSAGGDFGQGGAIANGAYVRLQGGGYRYDSGAAQIVNSTFFANAAPGSSGAAGGAIAMTVGLLYATNCTFTENRAPSTVVAGGAAFYRNCIFARTRGGGNIVGIFGDLGYNISDDNSWPLNGPGSQYNIDARLGSLADNSGPTKTVALLEGSPAVDATEDSSCPAVDQRGFARPAGAHCDIGAYEGSLPLPNFSRSFSPASIVEGGTTRLEFTMQNSNSVSYTGVAFTNVLPAQIRIAAIPAISNGCGNGTIIALPGSGSVIFYDGTLASNQTCSIGLSVTSVLHGIWTNPPLALWSDETGEGRSNSPVALSVTGVPVITAAQVSNFASNSASLRAMVDPAGLPTSVFFQYGTDTSLGSATPPVEIGGGYVEALATADLGGLTSDTTYFYRAVASNAVGVSYGAISSFATYGAPLASSWCDQAALLAVLSVTNVVKFACDGTITLTNTLTIDRDTTLDGTGHNVVLSGGNAVRVLKVNPGVRLTLVNLTIANGLHTGTNATNLMGAGGPGFGAGIYNQGGTVTLLNCVLTNNVAGGGNGGAYGLAGPAEGGAIFNDGGMLLITNSLLQQNTASGGSTGPTGPPTQPVPPSGDGFGGGICSKGGTLFIASSRFRENIASSGRPLTQPYGVERWGSASGGAVHLDGGLMSLDECYFTANSVTRSNVFILRYSFGSGAYTGGAITVSNAILTCGRTIFETNQVYVPDAVGGGGAIFNSGEARIVDCVLAGNRSIGISSSGVGVDGRGGGMYSVSNLAISGSTFVGNVALGGNSRAQSQGPGSNLGASGLGGGIYSVGSLELTNSTLFLNEARGGDGFGSFSPGVAGLARGGAIFNAGGSIQATHITLSGNSTIAGIGTTSTNPLPTLGGGIFSTNGTVTLWNSIVANSPSGSNCFGAIIDGGHNISSDSSCNFTAPGSLNNTDPKLSDLGDFGGPTPTLALLDGSPALDAADAASCPPTDQRGFARPYGSGCDIGAFEWWPIFSIRGIISGWGPGGVRVTAGNAATTANAGGEYILNGLLAGSYTVRPGGSDCVLMPSSQAVVLGPDAANVDFISYRSNAFTLEKVGNSVSRFIFAGAPQQSYQLLVSSNCVGWESLTMEETDTNGFFQFYVTNGVNAGPRFFQTEKP